MESSRFALIGGIMFGLAILIGNIYNASQEPNITIINQTSDKIYNTSYKKIDTYDDITCPYGEEVIGMPIKVLIRRGELTDEITFQDNYVFRLSFANRINWSSYSDQKVKIYSECGSIKTVEAMQIGE